MRFKQECKRKKKLSILYTIKHGMTISYYYYNLK